MVLNKTRAVIVGALASFAIVAGAATTSWATEFDVAAFNAIKSKIPAQIKTAAEFTKEEKATTLKRFFGDNKDKVETDITQAGKIVVSLKSAAENKFEVAESAFEVGSDMRAMAAQYIRSNFFNSREEYVSYIDKYLTRVTGVGTVSGANIPMTSNALVLVYRVGSFGVPGKNPVNYIDFGQMAGAGAPAIAPAEVVDGSVMTFGRTAEGNFAMNFLSSNGFPNQYAFVVAYVGNGVGDDIKEFKPGTKIKIKTLVPAGIESEVIPTEYTGVEEEILSNIPADSNAGYLSVKKVEKKNSKVVEAKLAKAEDVLFSFDIKALKADGALADKPGKITVKIPVVNAGEIKTLKSKNEVVLYHVKDNKETSAIDFDVAEGHVVFTVDNFSEFTLVKKSTSATVPNTSDANSVNYAAIALALVAILGGLATFVIKKA